MSRRLSQWFGNLRLTYKFLLILLTAMVLVCGVVLAVVQIPYRAYNEQLYQSSVQLMTLFSREIQSELDDVEALSYRILADNVLQKSLSTMRSRPVGTASWTGAKTDIGNRMSYYSIWFSSAISLHLRAEGGTSFNQSFGTAFTYEEITPRQVELAAQGKGRAVWVVDAPDGAKPELYLLRQVREVKNLSLKPLATIMIHVDLSSTAERYRASIGHLSSPFSCAIYDGDTCLYASDEQVRGLDERSDGYTFMQVDGQDYLCVRLTAANGWQYVALVDYSDINATIGTAVRFTMVIMLVAMVLALAVGALLISTVVRHLKALVDKFDAFAISGHPVPEENDPYLDRKDEIGQLHRHFNKMTRDYDRMTKDNSEKQRLLQEKQMQQLRAQVRPHFLYNTLESIYCLAKDAGNERIATMANALGKMLRASLNDKRDIVTVAEDLDITRQYMSIQLLRYGDRLRVEYDIPEELMDCRLPAMTLQPLVENAVHHAAEEMLDTCVIRIGGRAAAEGVDLVVEDNGPGMDEDILEKLESGEIKPEGMGIGMRNIHQRVQYAFSAQYGLRVESRPGLTRIIIHLPDHRARRP